MIERGLMQFEELTVVVWRRPPGQLEARVMQEPLPARKFGRDILRSRQFRCPKSKELESYIRKKLAAYTNNVVIVYELESETT